MKVCIIILLLCTGSSVLGQLINYQILEDNPSRTRNNFVALEFLNAEFGGNKNVNIIGIGANGNYSLGELLGVDGNFRYVLIKDPAVPSSFQLDAGIYRLFSKTRESKSDIKVRVGGDFVIEENRHVFKEKFIRVPGTTQVRQGLRAGLAYFQKAYKDQDIEGKPEVPYQLMGAYGGWMMVRQTNLVVQANDSDNENLYTRPLHYRGFTKIYADLMVTPISARTFSNPSWEDETKLSTKMLGFRVGYLFYKDGIKWYDKIMWGSEIGGRPYEGAYLKVMIGYTLFRK